MSQSFESRRTFAIISHPDAGKTTLTEKLLLFGGAIQQAGAVKARAAARHTKSDWMEIEKQRGISVTASVMTFEYDGFVLNLLDTPGHKDFSEDTYRTLTAVDSAIMVLDAAKGIEEQTRKLFEVCRLRDIPIITFINKMDRDSRHPFELLDDIEKTLALETAPLSWPIGSGTDFKGCFDLQSDSLMLFSAEDRSRIADGVHFKGADDLRLAEYIPPALLATFREEAEMVQSAAQPFDHASYLSGFQTPVFFGSAINNFGVRELLEALIKLAPAPRPQQSTSRLIEANEPKFSGFVFKILANMDKNHRDRIAFVRICSGQYQRGMRALHNRTGRMITLSNPVTFLGREREVAESAVAGDILGIPNHGLLQIGDTLTEGENLSFTGIPSFAPELFQRVRLDDPLKSKQLKNALEELAQEGASQVFKPLNGSAWIVGVVGQLQFEVIADRLKNEYGVQGGFEAVQFQTMRWVSSDDAEKIKNFTAKNLHYLAHDNAGNLAYLAPNDFHLNRAAQEHPGITFSKTREQ